MSKCYHIFIYAVNMVFKSYYISIPSILKSKILQYTSQMMIQKSLDVIFLSELLLAEYIKYFKAHDKALHPACLQEMPKTVSFSNWELLYIFKMIYQFFQENINIVIQNNTFLIYQLIDMPQYQACTFFYFMFYFFLKWSDTWLSMSFEYLKVTMPIR